jgi:hypothetical protein
MQSRTRQPILYKTTIRKVEGSILTIAIILENNSNKTPACMITTSHPKNEVQPTPETSWIHVLRILITNYIVTTNYVSHSWYSKKVGVKSCPATRHGGAWGERRICSYSFSTSALDAGLSGQRHAPAALYPRERSRRYPLNRRLGGPQSRSGRRGWKKNPLPLSGIEPRSSSS